MLGTLFTRDFLDEGVRRTAEWRALENGFASKKAELLALFEGFPVTGRPNEAETEDRLVYPVTEALGWRRKVKTRTDDRQIPDALLFADADGLARADRERAEENRVRHADAILEAKRWGVPFDRRFDRDTPPMAQLMGYLTRAEVRSDRRVRWGVLTDGRRWRLSFTGAASLLTDFLEIDLAQALGLPVEYDLFAPPSPEARDDALRLFLLFFGADAFKPVADGRTFHERALSEGKDWEERVRRSLSDTIFGTVFPGLVRALKDADAQAPDPPTPAYLAELREAAFTFLYRLLFTLYAEDRDLLPKRYPDYDDYGLSKRVREDIERRMERPDVLSLKRPDYYDICLKVFETIDEGDESVGVPPFNGGLFARERAPLLHRARIPDRVFAPLFDALARTPDGKRINYRDLSVRELGAVYEKLLEYEPAADSTAPGGIAIRLNAFARKGSGSYYTPDELVSLIIERTVGPLVEERLAAFRNAGEAEAPALDPAQAILGLKICDPAMGSGHFLVALVDYLSDRVFAAMEAAREKLGEDYHSPVSRDAEATRARIMQLAAEHNWHIREEMVDDRAIVRRMVLKRCVFGVDKNPQAVELAKVALWLHTLTAGAPLSFLDHHLKCGDSLFGEWVKPVMDGLARRGTLLINNAVQRAEGAARGMAVIEKLTDADMAEAATSRSAYDDMAEATRPLRKFLDYWHARKWLDLTEDERKAEQALFDGAFGDPIAVAAGLRLPDAPSEEAVALFTAEGSDQASLLGGVKASVRDYLRVRELIARAHALAVSERFLHWQIAFPLVWRDWTSGARKGGFDAVIGNPPWDRMKMQEVEWFAARAPEIARQPRAADRRRMVEALQRAGGPIAQEYTLARSRAETGARIAIRGGDYPLLGRGDVNLYPLFVERAQALIRGQGLAGLLVPSGIASDLTASAFFKGVAAAGRIKALLDFENRRGLDARGRRRGEFFPDVDSRFKFCAFVVGGDKRGGGEALCGFFLSDPPPEGAGEVASETGQSLFRMAAADFLAVNPNTGTAPIFRSRRDADLTKAIYARLPVLVNRAGREPARAWPVEYLRMFDMTNDSALFWTREALDREGAYPAALGHWRKGEREWLPLYVGRMIHLFDHRAASVTVNEENIYNAAGSSDVSKSDKADPDFTPTPQYWVEVDKIEWPNPFGWGFAFRDIARSTDERTAIGTVVPRAAFGNTAPLITSPEHAIGLWACFSTIVFDYVCRQKAQSTHLNWYIVEQLPVVPPEAFDRRFGSLKAGEIVRDHVLRLSYTAWDLEAFARDMGHVGADGKALPPFRWDEGERRHLRARLDALFFHLYGLSEDEARYVMSTFPIVRHKDEEAHGGVFLTEQLVVWYMRALLSGDPASEAPVATLLRGAKGA